MSSATGVRLTMKFNFGQLIRFAGWSESYDFGFNSLATAISKSTNIAAFINDRLQCLGVGPILVEAVLSGYVQPLTPGAPPVRRNTVILPIPPTPGAGQAYNKAFVAGVGGEADFATTDLYIALQTSLTDTPVYKRNVWIAGLPDKSDMTDSAEVVEPNTLAAVKRFLGDLNNTNTTLAGGCLVSIRSIDRSGANLVKQCTAWNVGPNTYTVPAHGFVLGQPVIAQGMRTIRGGFAPRGRYQIGAVVDANTIALQGSQVPTAPLKFGGFRAAILTFNSVTLAIQQGFTKRNKGRPSGLSVGRRSRPATTRV